MADHADMDSDIQPPNPHGKTYTFDDFIAEEEAYREERESSGVERENEGE